MEISGKRGSLASIIDVDTAVAVDDDTGVEGGTAAISCVEEHSSVQRVR